MFAAPRCQTNRQPFEREHLSNASNSPSLRRRRGGWCDRSRGAGGRLRGDHHLDQRRHRVISAGVAPRPEVRENAPEESQVQDRAGRGADRHQRRRRRARHDRRRLARSALERPGRARLLPDRQVRDLRGDEQVQHALQPDAVAAERDLHRQNPQLEPGSGRQRRRHDRRDQPPAGRRRALELPDAAARRQEDPGHLPGKDLRGTAQAGRRKRPVVDRLPVQLPVGQRRRGRAQPGRRLLQQGHRDLRAVPRRRALLRGDQGQGEGRRVRSSAFTPGRSSATTDCPGSAPEAASKPRSGTWARRA